jgi:hypothetical protein
VPSPAGPATVCEENPTAVPAGQSPHGSLAACQANCGGGTNPSTGSCANISYSGECQDGPNATVYNDGCSTIDGQMPDQSHIGTYIERPNSPLIWKVTAIGAQNTQNSGHAYTSTTCTTTPTGSANCMKVTIINTCPDNSSYSTYYGTPGVPSSGGTWNMNNGVGPHYTCATIDGQVPTQANVGTFIEGGTGVPGEQWEVYSVEPATDTNLYNLNTTTCATTPTGCDTTVDGNCAQTYLTPNPSSYNTWLVARTNGYASIGCLHYQKAFKWILKSIVLNGSTMTSQQISRKTAKLNWLTCIWQECGCSGYVWQLFDDWFSQYNQTYPTNEQTNNTKEQWFNYFKQIGIQGLDDWGGGKDRLEEKGKKVDCGCGKACSNMYPGDCYKCCNNIHPTGWSSKDEGIGTQENLKENKGGGCGCSKPKPPKTKITRSLIKQIFEEEIKKI